MTGATLFDSIDKIEIFVEGIPKTKGSLTPFLLNGVALVNGGVCQKNGKWTTRIRPNIIMSESSTPKARRERKKWRKTLEDAIAWEWHDTVGETIPKDVPVRVELLFLFRRPKSVKASVRPRPTAKLDVDKLSRMILDCMTVAKVYDDDGQVCKLVVEKDYAKETSVTGVRIRVSSI